MGPEIISYGIYGDSYIFTGLMQRLLDPFLRGVWKFRTVMTSYVRLKYISNTGIYTIETADY